MKALAERDYFTDHSILRDPYSYFEAIREHGPVYRLPDRDMLVVTGFDEVLEVLKNSDDFSSVIAPQGPAVALPFQAEGDNITPQIEAHRAEFVGGDMLVAYDDATHTFNRALLSRLFTPSRLKSNEAFISKYADELVRGAVAKGGCELIKEIATPFVTLVIADLLGVPPDDRQLFMEAIESGVGAGSLDPDDLAAQNQPLVLMGMYFMQYVQARRDNPTGDVLSELANGPYPDGSMPDILEIVKLATFLFGAGQDTSAKLLGNAMRFIVDEPGLQQQLRDDPSRIPALIEEVLRLEGSTKMTARLARKDTHIGDLPVPAGTKVFLATAAANRDPRRWDNPGDFVLDRPRIKEHLGLGRGPHVCAGAPLARSEVRIILEKFLELTSDIDISDEAHGPKGARTLAYDPSFIIRGLSEMQLTLKPAAGVAIDSKPEAKAKGGLGALFGLGKKPSTAEAKPGGFSTAHSKIGELLADPGAKAVIDKHFPGVSSDPRIGMGKGVTLRMVQKFAPDMFSDQALDAADADLAKLPGA